MNRKSCVFILSHGRADNLKTLKWLHRFHYSGDIRIIVDDEDEQQQEYIDKYGDMVYVFSKRTASAYTDVGDLQPNRNGVVYARNYCHTIAKELGYTHFLVLDDDYVKVRYRYEKNKQLKERKIIALEPLFESMYDFLDNTNTLTVAFAQGGDLIGGVESGAFKKKFLRKAMNTFFCRTDRPFYFYGRLNEDTTMYLRYGEIGKLVFTLGCMCIDQGVTQKNKGGLTEMYLESGTYVKSFYSVMWSPSCVRVGVIGTTFKRYHHRIKWDYCNPKILNQKYKKVGDKNG